MGLKTTMPTLNSTLTEVTSLIELRVRALPVSMRSRIFTVSRVVAASRP
jgi:hypothetical protein